jgi:hypothetical protein
VPDAPWRCSQCGTVNEPNANACRSCGRWPSLFDLEQGKIEEKAPSFEEPQMSAEEPFRHEAPPPREVEVPIETVETVETERGPSDVPTKEWPGPENPLDRPVQGWPRIASWIVPIAFLVYVVISIIANR